MLTLTKTDNSIEFVKNKPIVRYAYGNELKSTWFITKNKRSILPHGSRLLFIMSCEKSEESIRTSKTYPNVGDIISDVDGQILKIIHIDWI